MRIEQSITELLYRYQCVTIPEFGAFLSETIPSQYFQDTQAFFPPKKIVSFNLHIKNNDGLLANHLAQKEQVTYDVAVRFIALIVEEWKQSLSNKEILIFEKLGKISLNQDNYLVFRAFDHTNFYLESFGLATIQAKTVARREDFQSEALVQEEINEAEELTDTKQDEVDVVVLSQSTTSRSWIRYAASIVLFVGVSGVVSGYFYNQKIEKETQLVSQKVQEQVEQKIQEATFFIENPLPAITLTFQNPDQNYHIVGGAFKELRNAEKFAAMLTNEGFESEIGAVNKFGLYPVFYGSYTTNDSAIEALASIKQLHNPQAWVLFSE